MSSTDGSSVRARAIATRCFMPPEERRWQGVFEPLEADQLDQVHGGPPVLPPLGGDDLQRQVDVPDDAAPGREHRVLEHEREGVAAPRLGRAHALDQQRALHRIARARRSATALRNVDLPQPEGPMSDTNAFGATSRSMPSSATTAFAPRP